MCEKFEVNNYFLSDGTKYVQLKLLIFYYFNMWIRLG